MHIKRQLVKATAAWLCLAAFMMLSNPSKLPVVMLILPFLILFGALYAAWGLLAAIKNRFYGSVKDMPKRRLRVAVCASVVVLMILQSLGQLTVKDVFTLFAIVGLGYFFLSRNSAEDNAS